MDATTSESESACRRLIGREFAPHEFPSLIEAVFAGGGDTTRRFLGDDAQTFIDVIDEALNWAYLAPSTQKKCLKLLYRTCGRHALLPRSLEISVCYDRTGAAVYRGGFADVRKGEHYGRDVAIKVIRTYTNVDLQKIIGRFCKEAVIWKTLQHPNVLPLIGVTVSENQLAMVSDWMANGNINEFMRAHPDANRLGLLGDVTRGLIYIHNRGMVHGDIKGRNILIDQTGRARLADFGLLTIISEPVNPLSSNSYTEGGTARWMSPELIAPRDFGFDNRRPTKPSDCYALGMVIYETISGNLPFHEHADLEVLLNVPRGGRPSRGVRFTHSLWKMLEQCWAPRPNNRPSIEDVRLRLEAFSNSSEQPYPGVDEEMDEGDGGRDSTNSFSDFQNRRVAWREIYPGGLAREATDPNLLIPWIDSNNRGTYQVTAAQSPTPVPPSNISSLNLVFLRGTTPEQYSYNDSPTLSFISLLFPKASTAPHVSLSILGEPNLQVSHATPGELDLSFRLAISIRMKKMGIHFTPLRHGALVGGDMSNDVLHPFFVYKVQSLGMHYSMILEYSPPIVQLQAKYLQRFWEELANIQRGSNLDLKVQSMFFLTSGFILVRLIQLAHLYFWKTCKMLNGAGMRFIPKYGHPPEFSDEVHEKSTVLSQIIWMENYLFLTLGGGRPKLTTRIEEEFRNELPAAYPMLFRICPLTMRTQGILLVRDAVFLLELSRDPRERPNDWRQLCDNLASSLDEYSDTLMIHLGEFDGIDDIEGAPIIRGSCISSLAHLAALYHFVGEMQPSARDMMNGLCDAALDNLSSLTKDLRLEEVTYFDLLLKYSWTKAIEVFDSRISGLSLVEGAQLWYWKEIVVEACADFERRIPACEPPMLISLALLEDGTSEGSEYPNLIVHEAREGYGI